MYSTKNYKGKKKKKRILNDTCKYLIVTLNNKNYRHVKFQLFFFFSPSFQRPNLAENRQQTEEKDKENDMTEPYFDGTKKSTNESSKDQRVCRTFSFGKTNLF